MRYICHNGFTMGVQLSLGQKKTELCFSLLHVVQVQSGGTEKNLDQSQKSALNCDIEFYITLYCCSGISCQIIFFALQCYNCVWLKGSNINDPNIYDSQNVLLGKAKGKRWLVALLLILAAMKGWGWPWEWSASERVEDEAVQARQDIREYQLQLDTWKYSCWGYMQLTNSPCI